MNKQSEGCQNCKGKGGFEESGCGEGCCRVGVMCEACGGTGVAELVFDESEGGHLD